MSLWIADSVWVGVFWVVWFFFPHSHSPHLPLCVFKAVRLLLGRFLSTGSDWHHWISCSPGLGHKLLAVMRTGENSWKSFCRGRSGEEGIHQRTTEGTGVNFHTDEYEGGSPACCCNLAEQVFSRHSQSSSVLSTDMACSHDEYLPQQWSHE